MSGGTAEHRVPAEQNLRYLKNVLQTSLKLPGVDNGGTDHPLSGCSDYVAGRSPQRVVAQIEEFGAEVEAMALSDPERLRKRHVERDDARSNDCVAARVAVAKGRLIDEGSLIEPVLGILLAPR